MVNYGDHDVCFFEKNIILLTKNSVKLIKKLSFNYHVKKLES